MSLIRISDFDTSGSNPILRLRKSHAGSLVSGEETRALPIMRRHSARYSRERLISLWAVSSIGIPRGAALSSLGESFTSIHVTIHAGRQDVRQGKFGCIDRKKFAICETGGNWMMICVRNEAEI
ncbi:MAG: hypothetical protein DWI22_16065 [Planctomycetota bacterium]|nr:MAG: hypothetical protein DWI22_16065 [Planctomycetota bacterium]